MKESNLYNITVYQKTGTAKETTVSQKYTALLQHGNAEPPMARILDIGDRGFVTDPQLKQHLNDSNFIKATTRKDFANNQQYYEFLLHNADIGKLYLITTTVVNRRLYVLLIECNIESHQWNSESENKLVRIQRSFQVVRVNDDAIE